MKHNNQINQKLVMPILLLGLLLQSCDSSSLPLSTDQRDVKLATSTEKGKVRHKRKKKEVLVNGVISLERNGLSYTSKNNSTNGIESKQRVVLSQEVTQKIKKEKTSKDKMQSSLVNTSCKKN